MKASIIAVALLSALATRALAEPAPTTFPAEAVAIAPAALQETLAGKVYAVKLADGGSWRWQFKADGYFFFNSGSFSDSGKWSTKGTTLCSEGRKITASCNEIRQLGADLFLKRDNGEVIRMTTQ